MPRNRPRTPRRRYLKNTEKEREFLRRNRIAVNKIEVESFLEKAELAMQEKNYPKAIRFYNSALKIDPLNWHTWRRKGVALDRAGEIEQAIVCYDKAISLNKYNLTLWLEKAKALNAIGKYHEAIAACNQCLEINGQNALAWHYRGISYSCLKDEKQSQECFAESIRLSKIKIALSSLD